MTKRVLDVGQCRPDHAAIRQLLLTRFGAEVVQVHGTSDAISQLRGGPFALVLVNRKLDADYSDGLDVVRAIKADSDLSDVPVMLVSNYAEYQRAAVEAGAVEGFGKAELAAPSTEEKLARFLE